MFLTCSIRLKSGGYNEVPEDPSSIIGPDFMPPKHDGGCCIKKNTNWKHSEHECKWSVTKSHLFTHNLCEFQHITPHNITKSLGGVYISICHTFFHAYASKMTGATIDIGWNVDLPLVNVILHKVKLACTTHCWICSHAVLSA